ncbi:hypothetical protein CKF48_19545 [Cytobacillus kochii]|uniref:Glycerol operon regulatory protein n=2 Tax=Bacillaceae TaxID=186817 RepID=A0A248TMK2_9BACI|nr:hypothetical protein CKF48_19545 [Cytobacillus kochii]
MDASMNDQMFKKNYSMQTLHKALQILRSFSYEHKTLSLTELHKRTGLSKPSLQRLLSTLVYEGLLHKNEETKRYQLGLELLFLGHLVEKNSSFLNIAAPVMKEMWVKIEECISLNVIENEKRKCIDFIASSHQLQTMITVGQESPLYAGASAKILLAYFPADIQREYLAKIQFEPLSSTTIIDKDVLYEELQSIQQRGYAKSNGERVKGAISYSAPIFNPQNEILASISITIPSVRIDDYEEEELVETVIEGARIITGKIQKN